MLQETAQHRRQRAQRAWILRDHAAVGGGISRIQVLDRVVHVPALPHAFVPVGLYLSRVAERMDLRPDFFVAARIAEVVHHSNMRRNLSVLVSGYLRVLTLPFFAVKIPYAIYSVVGPLDESFGVGGGEDKDYCVRCYQRGFEIRFALNSYILHFQGKSTWRGAETREETAARDRFYSARFKEKWGEPLFRLMIFNEVKQLPPHLQQAYEQRDFQKLISGALAP